MKAEVQVQLLTAERAKEAKEERALLEQRDPRSARVNFCQGKLNAKSQFRGMLLLLTNCRQVNCFMNFLSRASFPSDSTTDTSHPTPLQHLSLFGFTGSPLSATLLSES